MLTESAVYEISQAFPLIYKDNLATIYDTFNMKLHN